MSITITKGVLCDSEFKMINANRNSEINNSINKVPFAGNLKSANFKDIICFTCQSKAILSFSSQFLFLTSSTLS